MPRAAPKKVVATLTEYVFYAFSVDSPFWSQHRFADEKEARRELQACKRHTPKWRALVEPLSKEPGTLPGYTLFQRVTTRCP